MLRVVGDICGEVRPSVGSAFLVVPTSPVREIGILGVDRDKRDVVVPLHRPIQHPCAFRCGQDTPVHCLEFFLPRLLTPILDRVHHSLQRRTIVLDYGIERIPFTNRIETNVQNLVSIVHCVRISVEVGRSEDDIADVLDHLIDFDVRDLRVVFRLTARSVTRQVRVELVESYLAQLVDDPLAVLFKIFLAVAELASPGDREGRVINDAVEPEGFADHRCVPKVLLPIVVGAASDLPINVCLRDGLRTVLSAAVVLVIAGHQAGRDTRR